jgi:hypothetical protein
VDGAEEHIASEPVRAAARAVRKSLQKSRRYQRLASTIGGESGIVGATGAIYAVYLTLSRQRREEAEKVRAALKTEISTYAKYVIGALKICEGIASKG